MTAEAAHGAPAIFDPDLHGEAVALGDRLDSNPELGDDPVKRQPALVLLDEPRWTVRWNLRPSYCTSMVTALAAVLR